MLELFGLVSIWQLWTSRRCQIAGCEQHRQIRLYPRQSLMHTSNPLVLYFLSRWWVWGISANVKHHPWHCPTAPRPCWKELQQTSCLFPRDWVVALDPCYPGPGLCGLMPVWQLTYNFFLALKTDLVSRVAIRAHSSQSTSLCVPSKSWKETRLPPLRGCKKMVSWGPTDEIYDTCYWLVKAVRSLRYLIYIDSDSRW